MNNPFRKNRELDRYELMRPASRSEIIGMAQRLIRRKYVRGSAIQSPSDVGDYLKVRMGDLERETFIAIFLDNQHRIIAFEDLFVGTIDGASVHPREVVKRVMFHNAAAIIFAHNHPSGISEPSQADRRITERLTSALNLVDVRVLDHLIVGSESVLSFAEQGYL